LVKGTPQDGKRRDSIDPRSAASFMINNSPPTKNHTDSYLLDQKELSKKTYDILFSIDELISIDV
jgi:hypothetical protein